jgi:hypothetical protein
LIKRASIFNQLKISDTKKNLLLVVRIYINYNLSDCYPSFQLKIQKLVDVFLSEGDILSSQSTRSIVFRTTHARSHRKADELFKFLIQ